MCWFQLAGFVTSHCCPNSLKKSMASNHGISVRIWWHPCSGPHSDRLPHVSVVVSQGGTQ